MISSQRDRRVIIVGSSGQCSVVLDALACAGGWDIVGLLDSFLCRGAVRHGYCVLGKAEEASEVARSTACARFFVAVGDNWSRSKLTRLVFSLVDGVEMINVIHPAAVVSRSARIGTGVALFAGSVVGAGAELGDGVLLNTASSADHDCRLGAFSSLGPGARLGGKAVLGEGAAICLAAVVREAAQIGAWSVTGAGATVLDDIPAGVVAYGTPARIVRARKPDDPYLR